jgi:hypothetical protein
MIIRWRIAHYLNTEKMFKNLGAGMGGSFKKNLLTFAAVNTANFNVPCTPT